MTERKAVIRIGFLELLTVLFIALKLFDVIDWSWWLVFAPMYVYVALFVVWLGFAVFMAFLGGVLDGFSKVKKK